MSCLSLCLSVSLSLCLSVSLSLCLSVSLSLCLSVYTNACSDNPAEKAGTSMKEVPGILCVQVLEACGGASLTDLVLKFEEVHKQPLVRMVDQLLALRSSPGAFLWLR